MRYIIAYALLIGFAVYALWLSFSIAIYDEITLIEPNKHILWGEIGAMFAIIGWAIWGIKKEI